MPVPKDPNF